MLSKQHFDNDNIGHGRSEDKAAKAYRDYRISYFAGLNMAAINHAGLVNPSMHDLVAKEALADHITEMEVLIQLAINPAVQLVDALEAREGGE